MDQRFDSLIDKLCVFIPRYFRASVLQFSKSKLGWHFLALGNCIKSSIERVFLSIRSEEAADLFIIESAEKLKHAYSYLSEQLYAKLSVLLMIGTNSEWIRFCVALLICTISSLGLFFFRSSEMCWISASILFQWLSAAMYIHYGPISGNTRQEYLVGSFFKACSFSCMLFIWFRLYLNRGIANNIILQSIMLILLFFYFAVFFVAIAFNKKQPLLLRLIEFLLGIIPALSTAAAIALAIAEISFFTEKDFASILRLAAACLLFISDRVDVLKRVSLISFQLSGTLYALLYTFGMVSLLLSAR